MAGDDVVDDFVDVEVLIPRAHSGEGFVGAEATARAATDVIFPEQGPLRSRKLHQQLFHRDIGIDSGRGNHVANQPKVSEVIRKVSGAHAPRVLAMAPSPSRTRGACAPQNQSFAGSASSSTIRFSNRPAPPPSRLR